MSFVLGIVGVCNSYTAPSMGNACRRAFQCEEFRHEQRCASLVPVQVLRGQRLWRLETQRVAPQELPHPQQGPRLLLQDHRHRMREAGPPFKHLLRWLHQCTWRASSGTLNHHRCCRPWNMPCSGLWDDILLLPVPEVTGLQKTPSVLLGLPARRATMRGTCATPKAGQLRRKSYRTAAVFL